MSKTREKFAAEELAICLSHYDLGIIYRIEEFARGSGRAPKVVIECEQGRFLLKRRARGKDDINRVSFTHQVQLMLSQRNFPLPHLLATRESDSTMLVHDDGIYEMFEFISGTGYDGSLDGTYHAGKILGLYHKLLRGFQSDYRPPTGSYHDARAIHHAIRSTLASLPLDVRPPTDILTPTIDRVERAYRHCARQAANLGLQDWPEQIVHGDWHPGNMLFREHRVVAVIDYDAARLQQRVIDVANGVLQFSIIGGGDEPADWPEFLDENRFKRFLRGYDSVYDADEVLSLAELQAVPFLMCEAMIAEAVLPIAATGSFGRFQGFPFLEMILRKVRWILANCDRLVQSVAE